MFDLRRRWNRNRPVYVVGGFMRSGTTMLMQALEAGGLTVDRAPDGDLHDDYELSADQRRQGWEPEHYSGEIRVGDALPSGRFPTLHRGHLIKCLAGMARYCDPQPGGYVVVYIHREPKAINASMLARWGQSYAESAITKSVEADVNMWRNRDDCPVRLLEVWYDDVLADPKAVMLQLRALGFPIRHVNRAARVIDPQRGTRYGQQKVAA